MDIVNYCMYSYYRWYATFQMVSFEGFEVGEQSIQVVNHIAKMPDTVEHGNVSVDGWPEEIIVVKSKVQWLIPLRHPFNAHNSGMFFHEGVIEKLQGCLPVLRENQNPAIKMI